MAEDDLFRIIKDAIEADRRARDPQIYRKGWDDCHAAIMKAAQAPKFIPALSDALSSKAAPALPTKPDRIPDGSVWVEDIGGKTGELISMRRAPRGSVGTALEIVLKAKPGSAITEIEAEAVRLNPEISTKSVGNELRRMEGKKYRRDRPGGYQWFLIEDREDEGSPTATGSPSSSTRAEEDEDAAP